MGRLAWERGEQQQFVPSSFKKLNSVSGPGVWCRAWPRGFMRGAGTHPLLARSSQADRQGAPFPGLCFGFVCLEQPLLSSEVALALVLLWGWLLVFGGGSAMEISDHPLKNELLPFCAETGCRTMCLRAWDGFCSVAPGESAVRISHPGGVLPPGTIAGGSGERPPGGVSLPCSPPCCSAHHSAAHCTTPSCRAAAGWRG